MTGNRAGPQGRTTETTGRTDLVPQPNSRGIIETCMLSHGLQGETRQIPREAPSRRYADVGKRSSSFESPALSAPDQKARIVSASSTTSNKKA